MCYMEYMIMIDVMEENPYCSIQDIFEENLYSTPYGYVLILDLTFCHCIDIVSMTSDL